MKALNAILLASGILLSVIGYFQLTTSWSIEIRTAYCIALLIPGCALTAMGYIGLLVTGDRTRREPRGFPVEPRPPRGEA